MSRMRCNNIKPEYNSLIFKIKPTKGDIVVPRTSGGIYMRTIPEGYYMNDAASGKKSSFVNFFKKVYMEIKDIIKAARPKHETRGGLDIVHEKGGVEEIL